MMQAQAVFVSDVGVHAMPNNLPDYPPRKDGQPDRRYNVGKAVAAFFDAETERLVQAYLDGDDSIPVAPLRDFPG